MYWSRYYSLNRQNIPRCLRFYHSENGVYGYKPKPKIQFKLSNETVEARNNNSNVYRWIEAYRSQAHRVAQINPVEFRNTERSVDELDFNRYGLSEDQHVTYNGLVVADCQHGTIGQMKDLLTKIYCGKIGVEFNYIESEAEREWLSSNYESLYQETLTNTERVEIAELLIKSQAWDHFLAKKFPTVKRYGGEGAENLMTFFKQILELSVRDDIEHIVLGMPHRGKLNLLTVMLNTRPAKVFRKFRGQPEFPSDVKAMCDIASHFNTAEELEVKGSKIRFSMLHNPSHLEAVNPVSMGKTRSKQQTSRDGAFGDDAMKDFSTVVLNVQLHGDGAFAGQGINQECLMMTGIPNYDIGGTIHMIVNNQVGFTTPGDRGRTTRYSSDLAKSINAPVLHVNGDDPEALFLATKLAFNYQRKFRKDIFIDLNCFRRWGHNELDDPTFTNPSLYKIVNNRVSVPDLYSKQLIDLNIMTAEEQNNVAETFMNYLNTELENLDKYQPDESYFQRQWEGIKSATNEITTWDTGLEYSLLNFIGRSSVYYPKDFNIHPHLLKTHVNTRLRKLNEGTKLDWATAEALAFGSLMYQGHNVRISGEDVGRGTFSHRHAMLVDQETNDMYIPLNSLKGGLGGKLEVANSILSEEAVLGYEYGMAIDNPNNLIIWEAQFGDFFNGAQIMIDTFIASGETKWMVSNGLVMLLPHGYDGAASEHSSCRIERFLQLTDSKECTPDGDDINLQIVNPTTPAQYYHVLRRQMLRPFRKPLVVIAPKTLLRLSEATSDYTAFLPGTSFRSVIGDDGVDPIRVKNVILCSGKHYYNLVAERSGLNNSDTAIIRVESLAPFPVNEINSELSQFKNARNFIWSQEEPRNMGAWSFVKARFENMCGHKIKYCGREEGATPAVGVSAWHKTEADYVVKSPFQMK